MLMTLDNLEQNVYPTESQSINPISGTLFFKTKP